MRCIANETTKEVFALQDIGIDMLLECGFNKPVSRIQLSDRVNIVQTVTLHKVILSSLAELSQFKEGLSVLGVHPDLLYSYFCSDKLTADVLRNTCSKLFTEAKFSEKGTNEREYEERAFINYLEDSEQGIYIFNSEWAH